MPTTRNTPRAPAVWLLRHDLLNESPEGRDPRLSGTQKIDLDIRVGTSIWPQVRTSTWPKPRTLRWPLTFRIRLKSRSSESNAVYTTRYYQEDLQRAQGRDDHPLCVASCLRDRNRRIKGRALDDLRRVLVDRGESAATSAWYVRLGRSILWHAFDAQPSGCREVIPLQALDRHVAFPKIDAQRLLGSFRRRPEAAATG